VTPFGDDETRPCCGDHDPDPGTVHFKPYVYGATLGTPSRGRPERVLAAVEAGVTEADRRRRPQVAATAPEPAPGEPERCDACGYLLTAPGHLLECGTE
jgi:hypothetical protein